MSRVHLFATLAIISLPQLAFATAPTGNLDGVQSDGTAIGWTLDSDTPSQSTQVHFYIDGPYGEGTLIGSATANVPRPDVNSIMGITGDHGFSFRIPDKYTGQSHQLYAYAIDTSDAGENPLVPGSPKTFTFTPANKQVVGFVDQITSDGTIIGWAYDPDTSATAIDIHVYIDGPAGQGTLVGFYKTTIVRSDVNSAYGVTGAHGFSIPIPHTYADGKSRMLYIYGIDSTAGSVNPQLQHSPQTIKIDPPPSSTLGDASISASGITIKTTSRLAGAIDSLVWGGKEFVNSADHGRQIQTAWTGNDYGECFNPTEAGSLADGTAAFSTSQLLSLTKTSNSLTTTNHPAFWQNPNTYGVNCYFDSNPAKQWKGGATVNTTKNTRASLQKTVTIGVPGLASVIKYTSQITFDAQELAQTPLRYVILENPAIYMPTDFKKVYIVNSAGSLIELGPNVPNFNKFVLDPVILATDDGKYALGLYSAEIPRNGYAPNTPQYGYIGYGIYNWGVAMGMDTRAPKLPTSGNTFSPGTYSYTSFFAVGTLEDVRAAIQKLSVPPPSATVSGQSSVPPTISPFVSDSGSSVSSSPAAELTASTIAALRAQIQTLLTQIAALKGQNTSPTASSVGGSASCPTITRNLSRGSRGTEVAQLQRFLIAQKFLAADSATGFFGAITEAAVKEWQAKNKIVSRGTPITTGYGAVGPKTRAALASCTVN